MRWYELRGICERHHPRVVILACSFHPLLHGRLLRGKLTLALVMLISLCPLLFGSVHTVRGSFAFVFFRPLALSVTCQIFLLTALLLNLHCMADVSAKDAGTVWICFVAFHTLPRLEVQ